MSRRISTMNDAGEPRGLSRRLSLVLLGLGLAACSSWHWEKRGAQEGEYARDETFCKQLIYTGTDGFVTNASVRRMHDCMQAKGWQKVRN